jgi:alpha-amylase
MKYWYAILFSLLVLSIDGDAQLRSLTSATSTPKSDAFIQGFYWNSTPGGIWWDSLSRLAPRLAASGISGIWIPAPTKGAAGSYSMGYDIYDHYDFGEYNQKGSIETRFGSRQELIDMINVFHSNGIQVYADAVMGHMNGGDQKVPYDCKPYPEYPDSGWLVFTYPNGSGRFKKDATFFYPNQLTCDVNAPYHGPSDPVYKFGEVPAHAQSKVKDSLIVWGQYLKSILGVDGFRLDECKAIDPIFMGPWLQAANSGSFAVAEYYGSIDEIKNWLYWCNYFGGSVSMFDFPLRFSLKDMCNNTSGGYDMRWLDGAGLINNGVSGYSVATFVDNHDFDRIGWDGTIADPSSHNPIISNKDMAYAYILFSEGRPCIWFRDYYMYGLDGKIDTLLWIRQQFIYGGTTKRSGLNPWYVGSLATQDEQAADLYIARRDGGNGHPAVYLVLNDNASEWRGVWVNSDYPNATFRDYTGVAVDKKAEGDGRVELWAPPRGYAVYVPDTTLHLNNPPYVVAVPSQQGYTKTVFHHQVNAGDPNNDSISYSISGNPDWLTISSTGELLGTPASSDTGTTSITVTVTDTKSDTASTSFLLSVINHPLIDGSFEGDSVWQAPGCIADTIAGWDSTRVSQVYVTSDDQYYYFGAKVKARQWMNWAFLLNTKQGGGTSDSWGRSILYNQLNKPDYILRGLFSGYAEFHRWIGTAWYGVGSAISSTEYADNITTDESKEGWIECRVLKTAIGSPSVIGVQFFITGNLNSEATFDACPDDQNTTAWSGITTRLNKYAYFGDKIITSYNLQYPASGIIVEGNHFSVYARAFGVGVTDTIGQGSGLQSWIGINSTNTNPSGWTTWIPASYNTDFNNYDEFIVDIGISLTDGHYYYASRCQYNSGGYLYGGYSSTGGGIWDSVHYISGTLRVYGPPAAPILLSPMNGSEREASNPTLTWSAVSNAQSYRLQVATDSAFTTIIFNDSTLASTSKQLTSLANNTKYYWRVISKNIAASSPPSTVWSFAVQQITRSYAVDASWNMLSIPVLPDNRQKTALFPTAISEAFRYVQNSGYTSADTIDAGIGYWIKYAASDTAMITGYPIDDDTIDIEQGWNLIGSITAPIPVDAIQQLPDGLTSSSFYKYNRGYIATDTLEPFHAYWIKADTTGKLVLSPLRTNFAKQHHIASLTSSVFGTIRLDDNNHNAKLLSLVKISNDSETKQLPLLPPSPPEGLFDVRFASHRDVESFDEESDNEYSILLSSVSFPLTVTWSQEAVSPNRVRLSAGSTEYLLQPNKPVVLDNFINEIKLNISGKPVLPTMYRLDQNYPNPFNPSTEISYQLPVKSMVLLKIFNILGEEVATLVDETQDPGNRSKIWNATDKTGNLMSSGLYFYYLRAYDPSDPARSISATKKMLILK